MSRARGSYSSVAAKAVAAAVFAVSVATAPTALIAETHVKAQASAFLAPLLRLPDQPVSVSELITMDIGKVLVDVVVASDGAVMAMGIAPADSVTVSETPVMVTDFIRSYTDSVTATDAPVLQVGKSFSDGISVGELAVFLYIRQHALADGVTAAEGSVFAIGTAPSDGVTVGETPVSVLQPGVINAVYINEAPLE